jgi:hypothetical protein
VCLGKRKKAAPVVNLVVDRSDLLVDTAQLLLVIGELLAKLIHGPLPALHR